MKKMKLFAALSVAAALAITALPALQARAEITYPISELGFEPDYYATFSTDKPAKGTVITVTRPPREEGLIYSFGCYENRAVWDENHEWWVGEELLAEHIFSEEDGTLNPGDDTITITIENDVDYVTGGWWATSGMAGGSYAMFCWYASDGEVWNGGYDNGDAEQLFPLGSEPQPAEPEILLPDAGPEGTIYRLFNPSNGDHLYTVSLEERYYLILSGWEDEMSPGISASSEPRYPVYRMVNNESGEHIFTADLREKSALENAGWSVEKGWAAENDGDPEFYGSEGGEAVYRLFNPNATTAIGSHHYTMDQNEIKTLTTQYGWEVDNAGLPAFILEQPVQ